eukprot:2111082-Rhodomonas_salina.3
MYWEADALVNDSLRKWLAGQRELWFRDAEMGTQTRVWATYTQPEAYWGDIEGAHVTEWIEGAHNMDPSKFDYL